MGVLEEQMQFSLITETPINKFTFFTIGNPSEIPGKSAQIQTEARPAQEGKSLITDKDGPHKALIAPN